MAVMIWRVMHSSAKARKEACAVGAEVTHGLVEADHALLLDVVGVGADQEMPRALDRAKRR